MFQSNSLLECEVPWKIDECCAVIDVLPVVPVVSGEQASEEFKVKMWLWATKILNL